MSRRSRVVAATIVSAAVAGVAYVIHGFATAEERMKATCAQIKPGMALSALTAFAEGRGLMKPRTDTGVVYLAERRSYGRHACKVTLGRGFVVESEHNYAN
jgi:hypothetical protein